MVEETVESLFYNKMALKTLAISEDVLLKHDVQAQISSETFWCKLSTYPIHLAANILGSKFNGEHYTREQKLLGTELIHDPANHNYGGECCDEDGKELSNDVIQIMTELAYYTQKERFFLCDFLRRPSNLYQPNLVENYKL